MNSSEARTIISKPNNLENFKQSIKKDGLNSFYILADFDRTLTRAYFEDEFIPSVISILRNGGFLTQKYADQAHALFNKYHPIDSSTAQNIKAENKVYFTSKEDAAQKGYIPGSSVK